MEEYSLIRKFDENCAAHPNDTAIIDVATDTSLSYHELDDASGKVYRYLTEQGIGKEDVVMILLPRGAKPFVTIVGVWKAGAAYVILETDYPEEKREFIKRDAACKLIIDDDIFEEMMKCDTLTGFKIADSHDLSYIVYTSGTTGNPKGVMHEYGTQRLNVASFSCCGEGFLKREDSITNMSPLNFTGNIVFFHGIIDAGATVAVFPLELAHNTDNLLSVINKYRLTTVNFTASLMSMLPKLPSCVKRVVTGAEQAKNIYYDNVDTFNTWVQSESCSFLLTFRIDKKYEITPVGKPTVPEADVCLQDENGNLVKDGEIGELCYKNPYFRGYLNLPDKNAAVFRNGYIRSGDIAKKLPDGNFQIIGRADDMVKINGNRVEPAEIEVSVKQVLGTEWVGVRAFTEGNNNFVCAYYIGEPVLPIEKAKKIIGEKLVSYMQPAFYIKIDKIPISANGKFKRNDLPKPNFQSYIKEYVAPSSEMEEKLCNVMCDVLNLERVGATDDFYEIGGGSISAIKVITQMKLDMLDVNMFLAGRTPRKIAALYEEATKSVTRSLDERNAALLLTDQPLSSDQLYFCACQLKAPKSTLWNVPILLKFERSTDIVRIKKAIDVTLKSHPVFSCVFALDDNKRLVHKYDAGKVFDTKIEEISESEFETLQKNLVLPFTLFNKPLYRVRLFHSENGGYLFCDFHHSIGDRRALQIFLSDVCKAYNGVALMPDYYFVILDEQRKMKNSPLCMEARAYYDKLAGNYRWSRCLKPDIETNENKYACVTLEEIPVDREVYEMLDRQYGVGKNAFFIAAICMVLSVLNDEKNVVTAWAYDGRNTSIEQVSIAEMALSCNVRIRFDNEKTIGDLYREIIEQVQNNIYYSHCIGNEAQDDKGIMLNFFPYFDLKTLCTSSKLSLTPVALQRLNDVPYGQFYVRVIESEAGCKLLLEYNACAYSEERVNNFLELFTKTAIALSENIHKPKKPVAEIMRKFQSAKSPEMSTSTEGFSLIKKFSENCAAHPNSTAIIDVATDTSMSYHELDIASGKVYRYLTECGIGKEDVVMILLPRGAKPFVTIVGVWKAGAAYVMLETDYPMEKREFIKGDTNCKLVIDETVFDKMMKCDILTGYKVADPHDLSYIVYTSGSTGNPKGILYEYGTQFLAVRGYEYEGKSIFNHDDRVAFLSPLMFTATIMQLHGAIAACATVAVFPLTDAKNIKRLLSIMDKYKITFCTLVPSLLRLILKLPKSIKTLITGGEPVTNLYREGIINYCQYGQSESGAVILAFRLDKLYDIAPVGEPTVQEMDVCLQDENGNKVKEGEIGEICYRNPYFRGYLNLTKKTTDIVRNGYIRSGDIAKILPDGNFLILGRVDDMTKINGNRVEPAEIEVAVKQVLGVEWVGVRIFTEKQKSFVCAYYTGEPKIAIDEAKKIIREKLLPYMVPAFYIKIDEIPLNANGKFKRKALPAPDFSNYQKEYIAPSNELEKKLCTSFEKILGIEKVSVDDDFYVIGGDSITTIRLVALLDIDVLETGMIFSGRTPENIAKLCEKAASKELESPKAGNEEILKVDHPLSDEQLFMFDYQCRYPKSTVWNIPLLLKFGCDTDMEQLKKAVDTTLKAHPVFSIRYMFDENVMLVQRYDSAKTFDTAIEEMSEADFIDESERLIRPFRLVDGQLYRVRIFKTERGGYLFLDLHHSIADGESIHILVRDICLVYSGKPLGSDCYFRSLADREEKKKLPIFEEAKDYYENLLDRYEWDTRLKTDSETTENVYGNMSVMIPVDEASYEKLHSLYGIGKNMFYIAVATLAIAAYNGSDNIRVSWVHNGRQTAREKNVIGTLIRDLYVGICFDDMKTLKDLFDEVKSQVYKNIYYSFYPYLGYYSKDSDDASVIYQANLRSITAMGALEFTVAEIPDKSACVNNLLNIEIDETDDGCRLYMDYNACAYKEESICRFGKMFIKTACLMMENLDKPDVKVVDIRDRVKE